MAELLFNKLECRFGLYQELSTYRTNSEPDFRKLLWSHHKVVNRGTGQPHSEPWWIQHNDFRLISMSGATSAQGGHPLYETARRLQEFRLIRDAISYGAKRSDEFANKDRIKLTTWSYSRLTNRLRLSSLEEANNARGVAKQHYYPSLKFEGAMILWYYRAFKDCHTRNTMTMTTKLDEWKSVANEPRHDIATLQNRQKRNLRRHQLSIFETHGNIYEMW